MAPTCEWGYVTTSFGRYGYVMRHLVMYPPDAPSADVSWAVIARYFPTIAVGAGVIGMVAAGMTRMPFALAVLSITVLVGPAWVIVACRSAPVRARAASLRSYVSPLAPDAGAQARELLLIGLACAMIEAAEARAAGALSMDDYKLEWCRAYSTTLATRRRSPRISGRL
jgi:hypothetical protein